MSVAGPDFDLRLAGIEAGLREIQAELEGTGDGREVELVAGPFDTIQALREFERSLAGLPGVSGVSLRAFDGGDRAVIEVRLGAPIS